MSETLYLDGGGYILVDKNDYDWISEDKWRVYEFNTQYGQKYWYVVKSDSVQYKEFLHNKFFPNRIQSSVVWINNDPFDYRRENLALKTRQGKKVEKKKIIKINRKALCILKSRAVIEPIKVLDDFIPEIDLREGECADCSILNDEIYQECLDVAAKYDWHGWKVNSCPVKNWIKEKVKYE